MHGVRQYEERLSDKMQKGGLGHNEKVLCHLRGYRGREEVYKVY